MINEHINLGVLNTLRVNRITEPGIYLEALDEEVILLPNAYVTSDMQVDDEIEVFVYTDSEDRFVSTTQKPYGMKDQFMFTRVVDVVSFGAFVDWGLSKDLFVPKNRQKTPFVEGETRIVRIVEDDESERLIGVEKITSFLSSDTKDLVVNQEVDLLVFAKTPMGYKTIIDDTYEGMIYKNEIFTTVVVGDSLKGYIKLVRDDGKIDISLQPIGKTFSADINTKKILEVLTQNHGDLPYNYKTDPDTVKDMFGMSKKAYKRALTSLLEQNLIKLDDEGMEKI
ncbi:MAG: S1-like domain-containing RNA-binding protein [Campylobacterota bacterium]|nr:S1-like domain-containing RNA-binding protein [Campylobacterota bacterium]